MFEAPAWPVIHSLMSTPLSYVVTVLAASVFFGSFLPRAFGWPDRGPSTPKVATLPVITNVKSLRPEIEALKESADLFPTVSAMITLRHVLVTSFSGKRPIFPDSMRAEARLILSALHRADIPTPKLDSPRHKKELDLLRSYLDTVLPSLKSANYELAQREAERWLAQNGLEGDR
jgi:hypothetical protein